MIPENQPFIDALTRKYLTPDPEPEPNGNGYHGDSETPALSDEEIIERCRKAKNAAKFASLFDDGDTAPYDHDDSRADMALASLLAYYSDDPAQLERLMSASALGQRSKWRNRSDYRRRTIDRVRVRNHRERYQPASHSHSSRDYECYYDNEGLEMVSLASVPRPSNKRESVIEGMIPCRFPSIIYGDGGTAKSLLAASALLAVASDAERWMGRKVLRHGPVIYLDFELDLEEQTRRVYQLAEGAGLDSPPERFYYLSGADRPLGSVLQYTLAPAKEVGAKIVLLDSLGFAVDGDMEASRDVLRFVRTHIKPFERAGITLLIVDHQSKMTAGESYHQKSPFGSVYKSNACRSVIQIGVEDQREGLLTVRFRHQKANFGTKFDPFEAQLVFHATKVEITHRLLGSEDLAAEGSLNTPQKIRRLLEDGPMFPAEVAGKIEGISEGTVRNALSSMRKKGEIEDTGAVSGTGAHQIRLVPPSSHSHPNKDREYYYAPPDPDNEPPSVAEVVEILLRPNTGPRINYPLYLVGRTTLEILTRSVLTAMNRDAGAWKEAAAVVAEAANDPINHPVECECKECL